MSIVRAVFERGIEVRILPSGWVVSSAESSFKPFHSLERASSFLRPCRPVLFTETREKAPDQTYLLRLDGRQRFLASLAFDTRHFPAGEIFMARHLAYLLIAMGYHCRALAEHYARISTAFAQITQIPGYSSTDGPDHFSFHPEPFFEFEALIGVARRSLDAARYPLWRKFSPHKGSTPRSLQALLATDLPIPKDLRDHLQRIWDQYGIPLTNYRDCIHHYVPMDRGMASAEMNRLSSGIWSTTVLIPDNPEARSPKRFTFGLRRDALSYSWELAEAILVVVNEVAETTLTNEVAARPGQPSVCV